ncbi:hypothetical protein [Pseudaestuariivita rosea]|uniref:hypothetical protein n=1 Tax=Pseudaestuariivita rosea TaxID=2763263 RepID=UPI001ABB20F8|nr:hypothetical protein [Pseudaestuariivita rosea]
MSGNDERRLSDEFNKEVFEETPPDKSNTAPKYKPKEYVILFTPENGPSGASSVKQTTPKKETGKKEDKVPPIDFLRENITVDEKVHGYSVLTRIEDEKSPLGVDGGHVSILILLEGEKEVPKTHFQAGEWHQKPETTLEKQIVMDTLEKYNGIKPPDIEPPDHDPKRGRKR